ncbi:MAG: NADH-quinone oxidoreductase subunit M [Actinobacteria bacterium]|nr:NADH-quinone oxidoreductase subunit M [Actinomycetota bacterium]
MMLLPKADEALHKVVALLTSSAVFAVVVALLANFDYDRTRVLQFGQNRSWISVINSRYIVGIDGISLPLLALTAFIVPLVIIYSWDHFPEPHNPKAFLILTLVLETGMVGTFVAQDLILFFVFFELVLLPMYFMIGVWGGEQRQYASIKFFLYTAFGSALMIVAFLSLYFLAKGPGGAPLHTFSMIELSRWQGAGLARVTGLVIFGGMFAGFGIKVPMFPFHTWLPDAHTQAPTQGSVILAAVLLKLGTYGFVRIAIPILPAAAREWAPWIGLLAVIGIIYGALGCLAQTDMKRMIAFSSVAHMGFVMLGIATLTSFGINAAIFGMVAHGLITGMLFFIAGSVKERYHTLEIRRLGGLLLQAPRMGWLLGFSAMASLGLPGLAGFWGEFPAILAAYQPAAGLNQNVFRVYMVVAALGTVFAAGYLLWLLQRVAFGVPTEEFVGEHVHDMHLTDYLAWAPMIALIVVLGVYPNLIFRITDGAVVQSVTALGR